MFRNNKLPIRVRSLDKKHQMEGLYWKQPGTNTRSGAVVDIAAGTPFSAWATPLIPLP